MFDTLKADIKWADETSLGRIVIIIKSNTHQKFAVIDQKIVWYGSINLLSFGSAEESIMRLDSINIANELIGTIEEML